jgi:putative oxygen-independent coproporphyrinogen III oxidase
MSNMPMLSLALYIHIPFCRSKCPYCDFNSCRMISGIETNYIKALLCDLELEAERAASFAFARVHEKTISSIYIGGGTPSILSTSSIEKIIAAASTHFNFTPNIEITIEANPGTLDHEKCRAYKAIGINRISLGVQSFQDKYLKLLGRAHNREEVLHAINTIKEAGFTNFNLDLMFGLPSQNVEDALADLETALTFAPPHLSWYQLTLEEGTRFFQQPPTQMPNADLLWEMQRRGAALLSIHGLEQYEVSAYSKSESYRCRHNINYWEFGDYLGVGAGAHGKITQHLPDKITRYSKLSDPNLYIKANPNFIVEERNLSSCELPFEFMLNALRLFQPIPIALFEARTGLKFSVIAERIAQAEHDGLLIFDGREFVTTEFGRNFLNDLIARFL